MYVPSMSLNKSSILAMICVPPEIFERRRGSLRPLLFVMMFHEDCAACIFGLDERKQGT